MADQQSLDLMARLEAPAGAVLILHVPAEQDEPTPQALASLSARTGLVALVLHGCTLEVADEEQMRAAGWYRAMTAPDSSDDGRAIGGTPVAERPTAVPHCAGRSDRSHSRTPMVLGGGGWTCAECGEALDGGTHVVRYWFDTEFIEDGETIDLLSIGVVCEDGREYYAANAEADWMKASEWVQENVLPHIVKGGPWWKTRQRIAADLIEFVAAGGGKPQLWAYYGDYDWVVLCQLFGRMIDLPEGWPMFAMDVKQLAVMLGDPKLPEQTSAEHHALDDARWTRLAWEFLEARR